MRAGDRLVALAGREGTAGELLLAIGRGTSAAAALVAYSGLPTGSAAQHLMAQRAAGAPGAWGRGGSWRRLRSRRLRDEELIVIWTKLI